MLQHLACSSFFGALRASEFMQVGRTTGSSTLSRYTLWTANPHTRTFIPQTCQRETQSAPMPHILVSIVFQTGDELQLYLWTSPPSINTESRLRRQLDLLLSKH